MTPLFLPEVDPHAFFEKQASIARMPDDDTKWPAHVLSNLHQQLPFLSQYEVNLSLQRVEPEAGFAFGHALLSSKSDPITAAEVKNPKSRIRIPIIVADRQLQPFHTFELEGNVYPLTSERVEAALLNPAMFDGPATKPRSQKSLIDQLYPPYQQRQGFGRTSSSAGMGVTKVSSAPRPRGSNARETTQRRANIAHMIGTGAAVGAGLGFTPGALRAMKAEGVLRGSKKFKRLANQAAAAKAGAGRAFTGTQRKYLSARAKELGETASEMVRDARASDVSDARKGALKGALIGGGVTSAAGLPSVYFQEKGAQADAFTMDPERLRTIAKLRGRETEDRYQTQKGLGGRLKSNLKNLALPVGAGLAAAGIRGGLGAKKGGLKAMQAGAKKGLKEGLITSGAVSTANIGLKERGLAKRQQQRAEIGMPRVGTLEDPKAVKAASAFKNPYVAMGTLGAGAMGTRSLMKNKSQMIQDMRDRRSGKINSSELKRRMKEYAGSAAIDAAVGGGLGVGGTAAVKKLAVPQIKRVANEAGGFVDRKARDAAREAMGEFDKSMDRQVNKIDAAMGQHVQDIDARIEKQVRNAVPNMAAGARDAAGEKAREAKKGVGARLKNMFRRGGSDASS